MSLTRFFSKKALTTDKYSSTAMTCRKNNNVVSTGLGSLTIGSDGKTATETVPADYRPSGTVTWYSKVNDGSNYVDCMVSISNAGVIKIQTPFGGAISGINVNTLI